VALEDCEERKSLLMQNRLDSSEVMGEDAGAAQGFSDAEKSYKRNGHRKFMDLERTKRYKGKLDLIRERVGDINAWTSSKEPAEFIADKKTKLAVYKAFQEIIESALDIVAMSCKDAGLIPKDDYTNIGALHDKEILGEDSKKALTEANGLRNRLIHRYNALDDEIAYKAIKMLLPSFEKFSDVIGRWLKRNL